MKFISFSSVEVGLLDLNVKIFLVILDVANIDSVDAFVQEVIGCGFGLYWWEDTVKFIIVRKESSRIVSVLACTHFF